MCCRNELTFSTVSSAGLSRVSIIAIIIIIIVDMAFQHVFRSIKSMMLVSDYGNNTIIIHVRVGLQFAIAHLNCPTRTI
uniref:Secreted protein n=1 Tax=Angiostrongylus cantonensis TaxID=6313 RepID=A0A0K0D9E3_ANGCA